MGGGAAPQKERGVHMDIRYEDLQGYADGVAIEHPGYVIGQTEHLVIFQDEMGVYFYLESTVPTAYPPGTVQDADALMRTEDASEKLFHEIQVFLREED